MINLEKFDDDDQNRKLQANSPEGLHLIKTQGDAEQRIDKKCIDET